MGHSTEQQPRDATISRRENQTPNCGARPQPDLVRDLKIFAYANNHYAGSGPGTIKTFWNVWRDKWVNNLQSLISPFPYSSSSLRSALVRLSLFRMIVRIGWAMRMRQRVLLQLFHNQLDRFLELRIVAF
jgi:hypothetical protein